nr:unnamed protein product [Callosobruchus analis]
MVLERLERIPRRTPTSFMSL